MEKLKLEDRFAARKSRKQSLHYARRKHFQEETAEPQISPLHSPGFPVEDRGVWDLHAALSTESRKIFPRESIHTEISPLRFASVEMTKGRAVLPERVVAEPKAVFHHLGWAEFPRFLRSG
jgi:hypothetical protein